MKERVIIIIDGSNFYFKLKDLGLHNMIKLNLPAVFASFLNKRQLVKTTYYVGKIKTSNDLKSKKLHAQQQSLLAHLRKCSISYSLGYLLKSSGSYHEKGVDVQMAVDILIATYEDLCDHIILVSSDTDLLPAIKKAREQGKSIEYVGFSHAPSLAMITNCTSSRLLSKQDLEPHYKVAKAS